MIKKEKEIKKLADRLGEILDPINEKLCSKCPSEGWQGRPLKVGCCSTCAEQKGHFTDKEKSLLPEFFTVKKKKDDWSGETYNHYCLKKSLIFDKKYGFFDLEKKRCKIPRHKRSIVCLRFLCCPMMNNLGEEKRKEITKICCKITRLRGMAEEWESSYF